MPTANPPPGRGCYWDEHLILHAGSNTVLAHPEWEWAERDAAGIIYAEHGCLFRRPITTHGPGAPALLRDFNGDQLERRSAPEWAPRPRVDNAMVKALARAFRWRKMLDEGVHTTIEDLARAKGVAPSYASRILRLALLAPEIVEAILDGRQAAELQLDDLADAFPLEWVGQRSSFGLPPGKQERSETTGPHFAACSGDSV